MHRYAGCKGIVSVVGSNVCRNGLVQRLFPQVAVRDAVVAQLGYFVEVYMHANAVQLRRASITHGRVWNRSTGLSLWRHSFRSIVVPRDQITVCGRWSRKFRL